MAQRVIGGLSGINTITVGGVVIDLNDPRLIHLQAFVGGTGGKATFRKPNGTSGYVVPGGKTLYCLATRLVANDSVQSNHLRTICQSDNDLGFNSAGSFTNPVYFGGNLQAIITALYARVGVVSQSEADLGYFAVATGKYLSLAVSPDATSECGIRAWGLEV